MNSVPMAGFSLGAKAAGWPILPLTVEIAGGRSALCIGRVAFSNRFAD